MRKTLSFHDYQVFLNYPFDPDYERFAIAVHFGIVAANLIPVCAKDLSLPDRPRVDMLVDAIHGCRYSVHDLTRSKGEGADNFGRFNMPIETGMALFYALTTNRERHNCAFILPTPYDHHKFASDLSGFDPKVYMGDELTLVGITYDWLGDVVPHELMLRQPTVSIVEQYGHFKVLLDGVNGSGRDGLPTHNEWQELMYQQCARLDWWQWRQTRPGQLEFPEFPISWKP